MVIKATRKAEIEVFDERCLRSIYGTGRVRRERTSLKRERCRFECSGRNREKRPEIVRACGKNEGDKIG